MLAAKLDWARLKYPVLVSAKIDGIRTIIDEGQPRSRTWKVLPNRAFRKYVAAWPVLEGLDGEIVVGAPNAPNVYNATMSGIMSEGGVPDLTYLVFDWIGDSHMAYSQPYHQRYKHVRELEPVLPPWVKILPQELATTREEVEKLEAAAIADGYEGIIVRSPSAPYKFNRSTVSEGYLLKLKRYLDDEAVIVGFDELYSNQNVGYLDEQGFTRHTSHKAGQVAQGTLGALCVELRSDRSIKFNIGTGFDLSTREWFWAHRETLVGKLVKFKYMPHGVLSTTGIPRHPVYLGLRDEMDL